MTLMNTLMKAGAVYAVGRLASNINGKDIEKITGITADDLKRYGLNRTDSLLHAVGLQREAAATSSTLLVLSGFAAGAAVGAGVMFLIYAEGGKDLRHRIAEFFKENVGSDSDSDSDSDSESKTEGANETKTTRAKNGSKGATTA